MYAVTLKLVREKIGPGENWSGENWSGRTTFRCQNWSDPGPLVVAKSGQGILTATKAQPSS